MLLLKPLNSSHISPQITLLAQNQLDGQGRARREAARRRKSEWKVNVAIPNSSRSNGSWQITPKFYVAYGLASAYSVRALQVGQYARYNVFVCGPKFITRLVVRITH